MTDWRVLEKADTAMKQMDYNARDMMLEYLSVWMVSYFIPHAHSRRDNFMDRRISLDAEDVSCKDDWPEDGWSSGTQERHGRDEPETQ